MLFLFLVLPGCGNPYNARLEQNDEVAPDAQESAISVDTTDSEATYRFDPDRSFWRRSEAGEWKLIRCNEYRVDGDGYIYTVNDPSCT